MERKTRWCHLIISIYSWIILPSCHQYLKVFIHTFSDYHYVNVHPLTLITLLERNFLQFFLFDQRGKISNFILSQTKVVTIGLHTLSWHYLPWTHLLSLLFSYPVVPVSRPFLCLVCHCSLHIPLIFFPALSLLINKVPNVHPPPSNYFVCLNF